VLAVSHDVRLNRQAHRMLRLESGKITELTRPRPVADGG
jgi:ABC-type siderophore export system fused ATPase/permease subunit